ncbi:flagellar hook capping FlgD N-terminal domain-containing protein [Hyphomonas sp. FCG-A18]|jgi:flagellar basal-body rod modification protein FlgD|uniref:flagellar hook assembly protein FlgD n=1 Tax=Hyphomonas sp. FCG-A18 TaxID=3080019 RepID=UPI002B2E2FCA|nr:flagellar hook capping FlgD N-terminal domain-containing protein [Hyphomonas sp. FCG-A18]
MTTVNPAAAATTAQSAQQQLQSSNNAAANQDFNTFIELLVAQVRNQDPLQPADSTQFVEQLATFSSLEQQVETNSNLEAIGFLISDLHTIVANEWLGKDVAIDANQIPYDGGEVKFSAQKPTGADSAELVIRALNGETLWTQSLGDTKEEFVWDGTSTSGEEIPVGTILNVSVDGYSKDGRRISSTAAEVLTTVTGVTNENGKTRLTTEMNMSVGLDNVRHQDEHK